MRHGRALIALVALSTLAAQPLWAGPGTPTSTTLAPGSTSTTILGTTVTSTSAASTSTTSTTLSMCTVEATFGSASCRLDDLLERVGTDEELGDLRAKLVTALERASSLVADANVLCDAGDRRGATLKLRKAIRRLIQYGHRLRGLSARRSVAEERQPRHRGGPHARLAILLARPTGNRPTLLPDLGALLDGQPPDSPHGTVGMPLRNRGSCPTTRW